VFLHDLERRDGAQNKRHVGVVGPSRLGVQGLFQDALGTEGPSKPSTPDKCPSSLSHSASRGFTLIEVILVVVLLSVILVVAQPALNPSTDNAKVSAAAGQIVSALEFAQVTAASSGRSCRVTIDDSADTLAVEQLKSGVDFTDSGLSQVSRGLAESESYQRMWHPISRGKYYSLDFTNGVGFGGVDITAASFGAGSSVIFDARGAPSDAGVVTISRGDRQVSVILDGLTGKVTIND
jgi:prepilin-type N-terminal cleavage/methylation domain-containing protein